MTAMVTPTSLGIRAEDVQDRRSSVAAPAVGGHAGRFAALLQGMNAVAAGGGEGTVAVPEYRVALGAVTLFAQDMEEPASDPTAERPKPDPDAAEKVVTSALADGGAADFRWLTTLFTQVGPKE